MMPPRSRRNAGPWVLLGVVVLLLLGTPARAHVLTLAELNLRELSAGEFLWSWGAPGTGRAPEEELVPLWPEGCTVEADRLRCAQGLRGAFAVEGVGESYSATLLRVTWLDGQRRVYTVTPAQPTVQLHGAAGDPRGGGEIAVAYTVLGVEHILGGIDHLLFVLCLLFVVGFNRRLIWTVSAFTIAHSLTLASAALGWLTLRAPPVETVIALSIMLAAAEALRTRDTLTRRWPALVAFVFGLVHGLGFAGALQEIGLPEHHLLLALLTFNVGVELGQLCAVAAVAVVARALRGQAWAPALRAPALYAVGAVAAFWSIERFAGIWA